MTVLVPVLLALLLVVAFRLRMRRLSKRMSRTPLGGINTDFHSPYAVPGRGRRSGKGF